MIQGKDLIINNVILPDNIDDIDIGKYFNIDWEILRFGTKDRDVKLDIGLKFDDYDEIKKCVFEKTYAPRTIIELTFKKWSHEFDIHSKLYEVKYWRLYNKLKWDCVTKHRVNDKKEE